MTRKTRQFGEYKPVGVPSMEMTIYDQTFKVRGSMSGIRILNMVQIMDGDSDEFDAPAAMKQFLSDSFLVEDRERGMAFLEDSDPHPPVTLAMLQDVIKWLIEEYTGNPTQPSETSASEQPQDGPGNSDTSSSPLDSISGPLTESPSSPHLQPQQAGML